MTAEPRLPARERFEQAYETARAPWDIGRPQAAFVAAAGSIAPGARVLDSGCGTGDLAIWLAAGGRAVTGVDFLEAPLAVARAKAAARGVQVNFLRMDARNVGEIPERFDAVVDCGLFPNLDEAGREAYVRSLGRLLDPGAKVFLLCISTAEPGTHGPRRIGEADLRAAFASGWEFEAIQPARFEVVSGIPGAEFSPGGARALFAVVRRTA